MGNSSKPVELPLGSHKASIQLSHLIMITIAAVLNLNPGVQQHCHLHWELHIKQLTALQAQLVHSSLC
jgi:hypothetical protein